ncbi:MAG TPA: c-type cytochrome [Candidatus Binatia bacterium]|nr:c-type cytochrome [Candidatus Binatia bacterium]
MRMTRLGIGVALLAMIAGAEGAENGARLYRTHCASCHGPDGRGDGPEASLFLPPPRDLRTGFLARYDAATLVRRILDGATLPLALDPPRLEAHAADVETIVAYLERLPQIDWPLVERGEELYVDRCEVCHGPFGHPPARLPPGVSRPRDLASPDFQRAYGDRALLTAVRHGRKGMPAIPGVGDDDNAKALVAFVRQLSPGYETYQRYCASCHGEDGRGVGLEEPGMDLRLPRVVFDRAYLAVHDAEYLRTRVWHMLAEQKPVMPHFRGRLTEPQARAIVAYLQAR